MSKKVLVILLALVLGAAALAWKWTDLFGPADGNRAGGASNATSDAGLDPLAEKPNIMNIEGLEISQGEEGKVLWNLVARQAEMKEDGGMIYALDPFLTYYMRSTAGEDGPVERSEPEVVTVRSVSGDINQQSNDMRFIDDVLAINGDQKMTTDILAYSGEKRTLTSPCKAFFESPSMKGNAGEAVWDLNDNMLYASSGVAVDWQTVSK